MFDEYDHNDFISLVVKVKRILGTGGESRSCTLSVKIPEADSLKLIIWDRSPAAEVSWEQGEYYQLRDVLIKKWDSGVELNAANKTTAEKLETPESYSNSGGQPAREHPAPGGNRGEVVFVHTTNTYLDRKNMGRKRRQEDYLAVFEETIQHAASIEADAILHTGNLFWSQSPSTQIVGHCRKVLTQATRSNIEFYLLYGERDTKNKNILSTLSDDGLITHLTPGWNLVGDVAVFGYDATTNHPVAGSTRPPNEAIIHLAAVCGDIQTSTRFSNLQHFASEISESLNAVLLGDQDSRVERVHEGIRVVSPGPPERIIGKKHIDTDNYSPRYVHIYRTDSEQFSVESYETSARPVSGFRLHLSPNVTLDEIDNVLSKQNLEKTAAIFEIEGQKSQNSLSKGAIEDVVSNYTAVTRGYDERETLDNSSEPTHRNTDKQIIEGSGTRNSEPQGDTPSSSDEVTTSSNDRIACPVGGCLFEGTLSQVIRHVSTQDMPGHTWENLGYETSYQFRRAHEEGETDTVSSSTSFADGDSQRSKSADIPLEEVAGIGEKRAEMLRNAGYETADDVAQASPESLSQVRLVSDKSARCIHTTAREECGYADTTLSDWAATWDVEREAVVEAYESLAGAVVPPSEARDTLEALLNEQNDTSVMTLSSFSLRYRHFLFEAGFHTLDEVADASIESLTDASYVGKSIAKSIRTQARQARDSINEADRRSSSVEDSGGSMAHTGENSDSDRQSRARGEQKSKPPTSAEPKRSTNDSEQTIDVASGEDKRYPPTLTKRDQWLLWKPADDGRKIPRAPWTTSDPLQYVSAMDPENWVAFEEAKQWQNKLLHDFGLAYAITRDDDIVFLDFDDVIVDDELSMEASSLIDQANSYAAVSTSGTGVHVFVEGSLPDNITSLTGPIDDAESQTLEVYDRNRFVAVTGNHLDGTPTYVSDGESLIDTLRERLATVGSTTPDRSLAEPRRSRAELRDISTTNDIQNIFDAIHQTRPSDIRLRSTKTRERSDGTASYDPSWTHSESGTRLAVLTDGWIYREGMIALDALQVVALEEGIITDEQEYPEGEDFWEAVEALRDRGAHIPRFEPTDEPIDTDTGDGSSDAIDELEVAQRINYGEPVRTYVHPYDRSYLERLALELSPLLVDAAEALTLSPAVAYRAAEIYAKGHAAGIVPGAAHESTIAAALRIASIGAGTPRPLADIAAEIDENPESVRNKFNRLMKETSLSETIEMSDLIVSPPEYVPYMAQKLDIVDDDQIRETARNVLIDADNEAATNPISEVAAAFYAVMKQLDGYDITQQQIADAAGLSTVTIRNNYRKYADKL